MKNPVKELMEQRGWTYGDLSAAAGICNSTIYKNLSGSMTKVNSNILKVVEQIGRDPKKFEKKYQKFREEKKNAIINQ